MAEWKLSATGVQARLPCMISMGALGRRTIVVLVNQHTNHKVGTLWDRQKCEIPPTCSVVVMDFFPLAFLALQILTELVLPCIPTIASHHQLYSPFGKNSIPRPKANDMPAHSLAIASKPQSNSPNYYKPLPPFFCPPKPLLPPSVILRPDNLVNTPPPPPPY